MFPLTTSPLPPVWRLLLIEEVYLAGQNGTFPDLPCLGGAGGRCAVKGVDAGTGGLIAAIQRAQDGKAGVGDVAQICADAALRAGAHSSTIEAMVASLKTDELQRRLDDLAPPPIDQQDNDLMSLPQAAEACGVNKRTSSRLG